MTVRHVVLTVAALAVAGLGIYLFIAVRATPTSAPVVTRPRPTPVASAGDTPEPSPTPASSSSSGRSARIPQPRSSSSDAPPTPRTPDVASTNATDLKNLDATMSEANKAYDRGEFDEAKTIAQKVLSDDPTNVRMLRIMVSANCIDGDSSEAQKHYLKLPSADREQMKVRCARYGIEFKDS